MSAERKHLIVTFTLFGVALILQIKDLVLQEQDLVIPIITTSANLIWLIYILYISLKHTWGK